jgi:hypothetical protein
MRHVLISTSVALLAAVSLSGCLGQDSAAKNGTDLPSVATTSVPSGTSIEVALGTGLTSENASVGDSWTGTVQSGSGAIPAGSSITGTVAGVTPARKGDRAMLDLKLASVTVDGHNYKVNGGTEAIIAGSTRARNLGAIAGSAAAGALIGKAVSGTGKGAVVGGVAGAGVATGVVAASDGYQVVLKSGTSLTFTTSSAIAVRQ